MENINLKLLDEVKRVIRQFDDREKYYQKISLQRYVSFDELDKTISREDTVDYALEISSENLCKQRKIWAIKRHSLTYRTMNVK